MSPYHPTLEDGYYADQNDTTPNTDADSTPIVDPVLDATRGNVTPDVVTDVTRIHAPDAGPDDATEPPNTDADADSSPDEGDEPAAQDTPPKPTTSRPRRSARKR